MTDRTTLDDSDEGSRSQRFPLELVGSLSRLLPGTAPRAPKRNVLVVLGYLLVGITVFGLLWTVL